MKFIPFPHTCCDCGHEFFSASLNKVRCPDCQTALRRDKSRQYAAAHPGYKPATEPEDEISAPDIINYEIERHPWMLVKVPPGCDFREGARFTASDLEHAKDWADAGMVFESRRGGKMETRRF